MPFEPDTQATANQTLSRYGIELSSPGFIPDEARFPQPSASFVPDSNAGFVPDGPTPGFEPDASTGRRILAGAARILPPVAGFLAGGPLLGGIGGGIGEVAAQQIERPGKPLRLAPVLGEAALGALPFGRLSRAAAKILPASRVGKAAAGALEGGLFGAGSAQVERLTREGRPATAGETAFGGTVGAVLGGAVGAAAYKPAGKKQALVDAAQLEEEDSQLTTLGLPAIRTPKTRGMFEKATPEEISRARLTDQAIREDARNARGLINVLAPHEIDFLSQLVGRAPREVLRDSASALAYLRLNRIGGEILDKMQTAGLIRPEDPLPLSMQIGRTLSYSASVGGMTLRSIRKMGDSLGDLMQREAEAAEKGGLVEKANALFQARRLLMTQMLGTQVRNLFSATAVAGLEMVTKFTSGLTGDPVALRAAKGLAKGFLRPIQTYREGQQMLDLLPDLRDQLFRHGTMAETAINSRLARATRVFNLGLQQYADKVPVSISFPAFAAESFARRGLSMRDFVRNPEGFIDGLSPAGKILFDRATGEAMHNSMSVAFRELPQASYAKAFIGIVNRYPVLTVELPFPRFMVSYMNFLSSYGPWGMLKLFARDLTATNEAGEVVMNMADPAKVSQAIARTAAGTGMLSLALSLRTNPATRGDKPYELKVPGIDHPIDMRPWAPLSTPYLTLADALINVASGKKAFANLSTTDIASQILGLQRIEGLAVLGINAINAREGAPLGDQLQDAESTIGDVLGSFFIPLRTIKDLIGDTRTVDQKSSELARWLGPTLTNIPLAAEAAGLPQTIKPTTGRPYSERKPVDLFGVKVSPTMLRQLGVSTIEKGRVESLFNKLGVNVYEIGPRTPIAEESRLRTSAQFIGRNVDRRASEIMGPLVTRVGAALLDTSHFQRLVETDPDVAEAILRARINDIRAAARQQAEAELLLESRKTYLELQAAKPRGGSVAGIFKQRGLERAAGKATR